MSPPGYIHGVGPIEPGCGLVAREATSDGQFRAGQNGVTAIAATGDGKVEFAGFDGRTLAYVRSAMGYPAYYPLYAAHPEPPVQAVLMDLDGTSVHSEAFWIWIIQLTTASLLGQPKFELEEADLPHVSGHSVSEHLQHCIRKYAPEKTVEEARNHYFAHTEREMREILEGRGRADAFSPAPGLRPFLQSLKARGVRIALVTSGLHQKAWPEIIAAFRTLGLGDPAAFYDAIVTAGHAIRPGSPGTLGELSPKPHPWLYAEAARVGLGIPFESRHHVIGLEDSGAGVCAVRLAGFTALGVAGGNIVASGCQALCHSLTGNLESAWAAIESWLP